MIEVYSNTQLREIPKEDFERDYNREQMILQTERDFDLKRLEHVENDIMKLELYDF